MNSKHAGIIVIAMAAASPAAVGATSHTHDAHHAPAVTSSAAPLSDGEVRKVDLEAKKITIRHGPLENLGMPPMTMVFQVTDPAVLAEVKAGDKIRFHAEKRDGGYSVSRIERY